MSTHLNPLAGLLAFVLLASTAAPAQIPAVAPAKAPDQERPAPVELPSVFHFDTAYGKDPFFPDSTRRQGLKLPSKQALPGDPQPSDTLDALLARLFLKGISTSSSRRLAMLNRYTFAEGEEREIKIDGQVVTVRCVTIKDRSAIIRARGRTVEIVLRDGL